MEEACFLILSRPVDHIGCEKALGSNGRIASRKHDGHEVIEWPADTTKKLCANELLLPEQTREVLSVNETPVTSFIRRFRERQTQGAGASEDGFSHFPLAVWDMHDHGGFSPMHKAAFASFSSLGKGRDRQLLPTPPLFEKPLSSCNSTTAAAVGIRHVTRLVPVMPGRCNDPIQ